jgi:hypothetical protein
MRSFRVIAKPPDTEYSPSGLMYSRLLPEKINVLQHLFQSAGLRKAGLLKCSEKQLLFCYHKNKWTPKEIVVHLIDDERIYSYRALCFARGEKSALPGFNQDDYARYSEANARTIAGILEEFETVRMSTLSLFEHLPEEALYRSGIADGQRLSVRALAYHITAHELHHMRMLNEKYGMELAIPEELS